MPLNRYLQQKLEFEILRVHDPVNGRPSSGSTGLEVRGWKYGVGSTGLMIASTHMVYIQYDMTFIPSYDRGCIRCNVFILNPDQPMDH